jgi:hypothetical protein
MSDSVRSIDGLRVVSDAVIDVVGCLVLVDVGAEDQGVGYIDYCEKV